MMHNNSLDELGSVFSAPAAAEAPICALQGATTCQYLMCLVSLLPELSFYTNEAEFGEEKVGGSGRGGRGKCSQKLTHKKSVSFN